MGEIELIITNDTGSKSKPSPIGLESSIHSIFFQESTDLFCVVNSSGQFLELNPAWERVLGYPLNEITGRGYEQFVFPDDLDRTREMFEGSLSGLEVVKFINRYRHRNGSIVWMEWSGKQGPCGNSTLAVGRNITDRREAEDALQNSEISLKELNASRDRLYSIIAHDLRSPIASFISLTQVVEARLFSLSLDQIGQFLQTMSRSASNLYRLLENLLEWAEIQTGNRTASPNAVNVAMHIQTSVDLIRQHALAKSISIECDVSETLNVFADERMLECILRNLLSNAVKFTPEGGSVFVGAAPCGDREVCFTVRDNGIGINREMVHRLFNASLQGVRRGTEGESGSGLGLVLSREFVSINNGRIWVESEEGRGSVFRFTMPLASPGAEFTIGFPKHKAVNAKPAQGIKALLVDDDPASRMLLYMHLKNKGAELLQAANGLDSVQLCRDHDDLNLILMDIALPDIDGFDAIRRIREFNREAIVIVQTAGIYPGGKDTALASGASEYMKKPVNPDELDKLLIRYFGG